MRILALSDAYDWDNQTELVDHYRPDVTALAGDLTSDGVAAFRKRALEEIPAFCRARDALRLRHGVIRSHGSLVYTVDQSQASQFYDRLAALEFRYRKTRAYLAARKKIHVDRFYEFLRYAGKVSRVLVVKGDHDNDFAGDYSPNRINRIRGCREISGKVETLGECTVLGLGFDHSAKRRELRRLIEKFRGQLGIVIAHAPQENIQLIAALQPRLLIRGHFGGGRYLIDGVPSVFTSGGHAVIELRRSGLPRIHAAGRERWESHLQRSYAYLQPYSETTR
jgi:predicted phosphodiesterase